MRTLAMLFFVVFLLASFFVACSSDDESPPFYQCGPVNCSGCCKYNKCEPGSAPGACGKGGLECHSCGLFCTDGECSASGCSDFSECGDSEICVPSSGCQAAYGRKWRVTVQSAIINQKNYKRSSRGINWDYDGDPDPFVIIKVGSREVASEAKQDTLFPVWNMSMETMINMTDSFQVDVWDLDLVSGQNKSEWIGGMSYTSGVDIGDLRKRNFVFQATDFGYGLEELVGTFTPL